MCCVDLCTALFATTVGQSYTAITLWLADLMLLIAPLHYLHGERRLLLLCLVNVSTSWSFNTSKGDACRVHAERGKKRIHG